MGEVIMTKAQRQRDRKYKIWLFLAAYSAFIIVKFIQDLSQFSTWGNNDGATWPARLSPVLTVVLWCVCFVISITISRRKFFQSKYVKFLFAGFYAWILWGAFTNFAGLSFAGGWRGYRECIVIAVFTHTLYMSVKIIKVYDISRQDMGITVLILGIMILYAYIA